MSRFYQLGCLNCAGCIVMGAIGGHRQWPQEQKDIFNKAILYHFMNGVGIILSSLANTSYFTPLFFQGGVLLFCLPLYHRAFTGNKSISGILPPYGGISMILGWLLMALKK